MQDVKLVFNRNVDWYTSTRRCVNLEITQTTNSECAADSTFNMRSKEA